MKEPAQSPLQDRGHRSALAQSGPKPGDEKERRTDPNRPHTARRFDERKKTKNKNSRPTSFRLGHVNHGCHALPEHWTDAKKCLTQRGTATQNSDLSLTCSVIVTP